MPHPTQTKSNPQTGEVGSPTSHVTFEYSYDELERISAVYYNGEEEPSVEYVYNGMGALGKVIDRDSGHTCVYDYDTLGRLISCTEYAAQGSLYTAASYTYDDANRVTRMDVRLPDSLGGMYQSYTYDSDPDNSVPDGALTSTTIFSGAELTYTYDSLGRLESSTNGSVLNYAYEYQNGDKVEVPQTGSVTQGLYLREGPGTSYTIIATMPAGTGVTIRGTEGDWHHVDTEKWGEGYCLHCCCCSFYRVSCCLWNRSGFGCDGLKFP